MNDDQQAGSKEIGGGGEWTALRNLAAQWKSESKRIKALADKEKSKSGRETLMAQSVRYWMCADELNTVREALAAAAPAPPAARFKHKEGCKWATELPTGFPNYWPCDCGLDRLLIELEAYESDVSPPPQDGQGAERLGPPRGGSSSDLADSDGQGGVLRFATPEDANKAAALFTASREVFKEASSIIEAVYQELGASEEVSMETYARIIRWRKR